MNSCTVSASTNLQPASRTCRYISTEDGGPDGTSRRRTDGLSVHLDGGRRTEDLTVHLDGGPTTCRYISTEDGGRRTDDLTVHLDGGRRTDDLSVHLDGGPAAELSADEVGVVRRVDVVVAERLIHVLENVEAVEQHGRVLVRHEVAAESVHRHPARARTLLTGSRTSLAPFHVTRHVWPGGQMVTVKHQ